MGADESDALLNGAAGPVPDWTPSARRKWQDTPWLLWWLVNFALAIAWGAALASEAPAGDPSAHLAAYATCHGDGARRRRLLGASEPARQLQAMAATLAVAAVFSAVALGVGAIYALRQEAVAKACVYGAIVVQIATAAVLGLICLFSGALVPALFLILYAAMFALMAWCYASQLKLCCKLLSLAAHALGDNLALIPATLASFVAGALLVLLPVVMFCISATRVGSAYPAPGAVLSASAPGTCEAPVAAAPAPSPAPSLALGGGGGNATATLGAADCCAFQLAPSAVGYLVFAFFFLLWSLFNLFEVRSFVVAHVTARWYHHPRGVPLPGRPTLDALQLSLGPASGSLCFGGAVLTCAELLRMLADAVRNNGEERGILAVILDAIVSCVLNLIAELLSALTRFATIRVALTGETFWEGACAATELFKRNMMNTAAVWSFPPMVLHLLTFTLSVLFAGLTALVFSADALALGATGATTGALGLQLGVLLFVGVALLFWLVLSYVSCILLNVVDTVYYCYALDIDKQRVTRSDVHELYELVPGVKTVRNPDGGIGIAGP